MESMESQVQTEKYAKCVEGSKRIRWDIDKDVFRGRREDFAEDVQLAITANESYEVIKTFLGFIQVPIPVISAT